MSTNLPQDIRQRMTFYRKQLLKAGMKEAAAFQFYKQATPLTAFIVNLHGSEYYIEITYGYTSTASSLMINDSIPGGVADDEITIREKLIICDEADELNARDLIQQMHEKYLLTEKDQLLASAKEKRKAFIAQISGRLKPLGFRKTSNTWKRPLDDGYQLIFYLQKSAYADSYYFNIYIGNDPKNYFLQCYTARLEPQDRSPLDWQALTFEEREFFLDRNILPVLDRIIHTPLSELGKQPFIWQSCTCNRHRCPSCWVEKNLWEAEKSTGGQP